MPVNAPVVTVHELFQIGLHSLKLSYTLLDQYQFYENIVLWFDYTK